MDVTREQALAYRWRVQELDRPYGACAPAEVAILDLGVQEGANDAARLSLINRGVSVEQAVQTMSGFGPDVALVWSIRGAPHLYRRSELVDVATATSPYDEDDAAKRVFTAAPALRQAGVTVLDALAEVGRQQREAIAAKGGSMVKGDLSGALRETLPEGYQTQCRPCGCVHSFEQPFRLAPLYAGLELEPGTSPPVLRPVPGWPRSRGPEPAPDPTAAPRHLHPVRAYLHFLAPATPKDVAAYLDAPVAVIKRVWPEDVEEVRREGAKAWALASDVEALEAAEPGGLEQVRLLSAFDLFTAAKDRALLTSDKAQHKELWPVLGRPGAVAAGGELLGTWRPKTVKGRLEVHVRPWCSWSAAVRSSVEAQAEVLARSRGQELAGVVGTT